MAEDKKSSGGGFGKGWLKLGTGFATKEWDVEPPPDFTIEQTHPAPLNLILDGNNSVTMLGLSPGLKIAMTFFGIGVPMFYGELKALAGEGGPLQFGFGFDIHLQSYVSTQPWENSQFSFNAFGGFGRLIWAFGFIRPYAEIRVRDIFENKMAAREGMNTNIDHNYDYIGRLGVDIALGNLKISGAISSYDLGLTSVASKEFAFALPGQKIVQYSAGVGFESATMGIWLRGYHINADDVADKTALFYQAPSMYPEYLLAEEAQFLEVGWKY